MSGAQHLAACREVALERVAAGELIVAYGGLALDLRAHPRTFVLVTDGLLAELSLATVAGDGVAFCRVVDALAVAEGEVTAVEQFAWACARALEHVDAGDAHAAMASLLLDLSGHPGTTGLLSEWDVSGLMHAVVFGGPVGARRFIEALPGPVVRGVAQVRSAEGRHRAEGSEEP